jgi:hypothetical protein
MECKSNPSKLAKLGTQKINELCFEMLMTRHNFFLFVEEFSQSKAMRHFKSWLLFLPLFFEDLRILAVPGNTVFPVVLKGLN